MEETRRRLSQIIGSHNLASFPRGGEELRAARETGSLSWRRAFLTTCIERVVLLPCQRDQVRPHEGQGCLALLTIRDRSRLKRVATTLRAARRLGRVRRGHLNLGGPPLGIVSRAVPKLSGGVKVPPSPPVVGCTVGDGEANPGSRQRAGEQLDRIAGTQPRAEVPRRCRAICERPETEADHLKSILVGVHPPEVLGERLADRVEAIRPQRHIRAEALVGVVEPSDMRAARQHDPRSSLSSRGFEHVVSPNHVGLHDALKRVFMRDAGQMHDRAHARHGLGHGVEVPDIGCDDLLPGLRGTQRADIQQSHDIEATAESFPEDRADRAAGTCDQHPTHCTPLTLAAPLLVCTQGTLRLDATRSQCGGYRPINASGLCDCMELVVKGALMSRRERSSSLLQPPAGKPVDAVSDGELRGLQ
jgi:hypothetical protein